MSDTLSVRPRTIYVCHAFTGGDGAKKNIAAVKMITRNIADYGDIPISPILYLPQVYDETTERTQAMAMCLKLLELCDQVQVHGNVISAGMIEELAHAVKLGKPIVQFGSAVIKCK